MLYMVIEYFNAGAAPEIYRRARDRGRQLPPGLEYVDSWVDLEYFRCFQLMRTEDRSLFDVWTKAWDDVAHFEIIPVRTSAEAARAGESPEQARERGMKEFAAMQASPFFDLWASAAIDEILSAIYEKRVLGG